MAAGARVVVVVVVVVVVESAFTCVCCCLVANKSQVLSTCELLQRGKATGLSTPLPPLPTRTAKRKGVLYGQAARKGQVAR